MPTIGWFEILIIVAIAIVVLGPKDFPIMLKKVGSWIGTICLLYTSPSPRDRTRSRMPSSA